MIGTMAIPCVRGLICNYIPLHSMLFVPDNLFLLFPCASCVSAALIHQGDVVHIPPCSSNTFAVQSAQSARTQCVNTTYTAVTGDYLYQISNKMNSYVGDLLQLNPTRAKMTGSVPAGTVLRVLKCPPGARVPYTTAAAVKKPSSSFSG